MQNKQKHYVAEREIFVLKIVGNFCVKDCGNFLC
jgi:hypothetical protein